MILKLSCRQNSWYIYISKTSHGKVRVNKIINTFKERSLLTFVSFSFTKIPYSWHWVTHQSKMNKPPMVIGYIYWYSSWWISERLFQYFNSAVIYIKQLKEPLTAKYLMHLEQMWQWWQRRLIPSQHRKHLQWKENRNSTVFFIFQYTVTLL